MMVTPPAIHAWPCDHIGRSVSQWDLSGADRHQALMGAIWRTMDHWQDARLQHAVQTVLTGETWTGEDLRRHQDVKTGYKPAPAVRVSRISAR
jgi:hypothetical protein